MPEPWEDLVDAEAAYLAQRMAVFAHGPQQQLRCALGSFRGRGTALRVLLDAEVELVMDLVDAVFAAAVLTHPQTGTARHVLARLDPGWLAATLRPLVVAQLADPAATWEEYRRLAELLDFLSQPALLELVLDRAAASTDPDIQEVADDFRPVG